MDGAVTGLYEYMVWSLASRDADKCRDYIAFRGSVDEERCAVLGGLLPGPCWAKDEPER